MRISDWSSDVCSSDLRRARRAAGRAHRRPRRAGDEMKPQLICDCDEVLLHMVCHFGTWLRETHDICFTPDGGDLARSMTRQDGTRPTPEEMRSEEHTSELQSIKRNSYAGFCLKKKKHK